ncbi:aerobic respiration control sensor protein ArcB [Oxobacter pfennigii]|uniref:Stage 0 sporulation protein A homolog n=1 Tax=Oxobacter pfennigii TaxID=36849 RepID=A0A0P8X129_9CLOT|nr:ATP-binding protein [Oxobacter pfennigii]KPU44502.1 aerobic respiration control sensor protein ArcB [Oxobacter pfennigii]
MDLSVRVGYGVDHRMRKMLMALIAVSLGCFFLLFGLLKVTDNKGRELELSQHGLLDLTDWDFTSDQVVPLDGQWEFYWNRLLEPGIEPGSEPTFIQVPGFWQQNIETENTKARGGATYRLQVKLKPSSMIYGLRISNIRMASTIYVNGNKVGESGIPALSQGEYQYENKPYNVFFPVQGETAEILIHAANYENNQGGIPYRLYLGSAQGIHTLNTNTTLLNMSLIVSLLLLGSYQLSVFIIRREEKGLLYFGLSCIVIAWSYASTGDRLLIEYFNLPTEVFYKIQAISLYSSLIPMAMFIKTICKDLIPRWLIRSIIYPMGLYSSFVLIAPFKWYSPFNLTASLVQAAAYIIIMGLLLYSYWKGKYGEFNRKGLGLFILALGCYLIGLMDYALYLCSVVLDYKVGYYAILSFCFLASFIMSYRFSEAYNTIESMAAKLQKADKQKDEFLLHTSHEFQTPLHAIINLSQSMLETGEELKEDHMQNLSVIRDTSRRLSALVRDILDLDKIKRNELSVNLAEVDVRVTVSLVFDLLQHLIVAKKIRLVNAVPADLPLIYADENRLKQIIQNLVGNGMKFTGQGTITVSAQAMGKQVKILVEDTGAGIDPDSWDAVFEPFEQAHSPNEYGGTGLGLFICRRLLQLMNGEIYIDWSEPGKGTRIAFILPMADEGSNQAQEAVQAYEKYEMKEQRSLAELPQRSTGKFTLLAVDDQPANLQVLARLFANEPYNLLWAMNGAEALEILKSRPNIDLILLDVMMPRMSGYDVCREIRKQFSLFELPVILLTVRYSPNDIAAGFKAGANDFIIKPFDALEIRSRTETLLQLKQSVEAAMKAELDFLQSQIKPHFLFNSLNAIITLCRTDGLRAEKLISHLSYYLRRCFDPRPDSFMLLEDELRLVEAYVEIEKARFEDRLTVLYDVHPDALKKKILPLTIQPLVENAIRHGVMKNEEGGTVRLTIKSEGDMVHVEVWDNGSGISRDQLNNLWHRENPASHRRGVGLANIRRRLMHFCAEELKVTSRVGEWTRVQFTVKEMRKQA